MTYKEQYELFLEKTEKDFTYEEWLELQLTGKVKNKYYNNKKISQFDTNGTHLKDFMSIKEAASETGIHRITISRNLNNPEKYKHGGGYIWKMKK